VISSGESLKVGENGREGRLRKNHSRGTPYVMGRKASSGPKQGKPSLAKHLPHQQGGIPFASRGII